MIVISDTTPIISLMKIRKLDLLKDLFDKVYIPVAVYEELVSNTFFANESRQIAESDFIIKRDVGQRDQVAFLQRATGLDLGESESIILSDELKSDILLMDEALGRNVARNMGLHIMGTIGILKTAHEMKLLTVDEIKSCIVTLQSCGRYISERLYNDLLNSLCK